MGLLDILSNPQMIGMAMAGLSRDREAPMNAMKSMGMVEDINQKRLDQAKVMQEEARKQAAQAQTMQLLKSYGQFVGTEPEPDYSMLPPDLGNYLKSRRAVSAAPRASLMQALSGAGEDANPAIVSSIINHISATRNPDDDITKEYFKSKFTPEKDTNLFDKTKALLLINYMKKNGIDTKPLEDRLNRLKPTVQGGIVPDAGTEGVQPVTQTIPSTTEQQGDPFAGMPIGLQKMMGVYAEPDKEAAAMRSFEEVYPQYQGKKGTPGYAAAWEKYKNLTGEKMKVGVTIADARTAGYGKIRSQNVFDTESAEIVPVTMDEIANDQSAPPGKRRYLSGTAAEKALKQINLIQDIKTNINATRGSLNRLQKPFDESTRAQLYMAVNANDPKSALGNLVHGQFGKSLSPDQIDYVTDMLQLTENAMAMRSVVGMGQGALDVRDAIRATVPSKGTFSPVYANAQLDKFDRTLSNLSRGIPGGKRLVETMFSDKTSPTPAPGGSPSITIRYDNQGRRIP